MLKASKQSIIIFGDSFTFPEGEAATNRVYTYAKGFYEHGLNTHVVCFASEYNTFGDGIKDGINYYHPFGQRKRNKWFVNRLIKKVLKYFFTLVLVKKISKNQKIVALLCDTHLSRTQFFGYILAKSIKTLFFLECNEHPLRNYQNSSFKRLEGIIKTYLETKFCDSIFCISQYLIDFYKNRGMNPQKLFLVPSTVDVERFNCQNKSPLNFPYILYCGNLNYHKDGLDILIESFARISKTHQGINLAIIGKSDTDGEEENIRKLATELGITDSVYFLGKQSRDDVPAYMINAKILALARPSSFIADAGFPSKLTEYLATGKPVVVTRVGEIPMYLKDKENAYISEPDSIEAFTEKLEYVLSNYETALQVGESGKTLTSSVFNHIYQANKIINYINNTQN